MYYMLCMFHMRSMSHVPPRAMVQTVATLAQCRGVPKCAARLRSASAHPEGMEKGQGGKQASSLTSSLSSRWVQPCKPADRTILLRRTRRCAAHPIDRLDSFPRC
jgi:hypothetical protein